MEDKLEALRREIDATDKELAALFAKRMSICREIAKVKAERGVPTCVPKREAEVLDRVAATVGEELSPYARRLWETVMELSREYQRSYEE